MLLKNTNLLISQSQVVINLKMIKLWNQTNRNFYKLGSNKIIFQFFIKNSLDFINLNNHL